MTYCWKCGEVTKHNAKICPFCKAPQTRGNPHHATRDVPDEQQRHGRQANQPQHSENSPKNRPQEHTPSKQKNVQETEWQQPRKTGEELLQDRTRGFDFATYYGKQRGWKPILIGALLLLGSVLIIPALILFGYSYRVGRSAATGKPTPPAYGNWGGLAVDGLRWFIVTFVSAFIWLLVAGLLYTIDPVLGIIAGVATYWFVGAFLTAFIGNGSVIGAFTDGRALRLFPSAFFLKTCLGFLLFIFAMNIIFNILLFTIIGGIIFGAYIIVGVGAYWGYVHYHATNKGILPPPSPFVEN